MAAVGIFRRGAAMAALAVMMATISVGSVARAQIYPTRPVTLLVPYAPGGPTDVIARILGERMGRAMNQTFIVDNAPGAGGTIAADKLAKATPDGHMLMLHHLALLAAPGLYPSLRYDTRTAFAPVGLVNAGPLVLVTRKTLPVANAAELYAWIKTNGNKVTAGHAGAGTNSHLCGVQIEQALGVKVTFVAYRGAAPAMNDLMAGQIDLICDQSTNSVPQILAGTIKAFAVTSAVRNAAIPDVPTFGETGLPQVDFNVWHALYAPRGTPEPVLARLNAELAAAVDDPEVQKKFANVGTVVYPPDQRAIAAHAKLFASEFDRVEALVKAAGIKPGEGH